MLSMYFKKKDGTDYPISKEEIYNNINVYEVETFIHYIQDLDLPWIPRYWQDYIESSIRHIYRLESIFGKYYRRMKMASFRDFGYADSERFKDD